MINAERQLSDIIFYDTTLRDGGQESGVNFGVNSKLKALSLLDEFGIHYIEGGWPGSNPIDTEFFRRAQDIELRNAGFAAFGRTRGIGIHVEDDLVIKNLLDSRAPVITLVGKASSYHVREVLRTTLEENLTMISDSIRYFKEQGREVGLDAEHFFDGFCLPSKEEGQEYALESLRRAAHSGVDWITLCDTNGGKLPEEIERIVRTVTSDPVLRNITIGIHAHDDLNLAVANSLVALGAGARQVQGTVNGFGERLGNADILTIIGILADKKGYDKISPEQLLKMTSLSETFYQLAGYVHGPKRPFVSPRAFTHKAGFHADGLSKAQHSYEHTDPAKFGNRRSIVVSDQSGRTNITEKVRELGLPITMDDDLARRVLEQVKIQAARGYRFENADASFALLVCRLSPGYHSPFQLNTNENTDTKQLAVSLLINQNTASQSDQESYGNWIAEELYASSDDIPSIFESFKKGLSPYYPQVNSLKLEGYSTQAENGTVNRVFINASDGSKHWTTIGVDHSSLQASWSAVRDALEYSLI